MAREKKRRFTREQGHTEQDLLQFGLDHLGAAEFLRVWISGTAACQFLDSAGYLTHLGIELILKSLLLFQNDEFEEGHRLSHLLDGVRAAGIDVDLSPDDVEVVKTLDRFFSLRYPSPDNPVSVSTEHLEGGIRVAQKILEGAPDRLREIVASVTEPLDDGEVRKGRRVAMFKRRPGPSPEDSGDVDE